MELVDQVDRKYGLGDDIQVAVSRALGQPLDIGSTPPPPYDNCDLVFLRFIANRRQQQKQRLAALHSLGPAGVLIVLAALDAGQAATPGTCWPSCVDVGCSAAGPGSMRVRHWRGLAAIIATMSPGGSPRPTLRWAASLRRPDGTHGPAMVARIDGLDGELIGITRTWLDRGAEGISASPRPGDARPDGRRRCAAR
jgi:hypothetical protein